MCWAASSPFLLWRSVQCREITKETMKHLSPAIREYNHLLSWLPLKHFQVISLSEEPLQSKTDFLIEDFLWFTANRVSSVRDLFTGLQLTFISESKLSIWCVHLLFIDSGVVFFGSVQVKLYIRLLCYWLVVSLASVPCCCSDSICDNLEFLAFMASACSRFCCWIYLLCTFIRRQCLYMHLLCMCLFVWLKSSSCSSRANFWCCLESAHLVDYWCYKGIIWKLFSGSQSGACFVIWKVFLS